MTKLTLLKNDELDLFFTPNRPDEWTDQDALAAEWEARLIPVKPKARVHRKQSSKSLPCVLTTAEREGYVEDMKTADRSKATLENKLADHQAEVKFLKENIAGHDKSIRQARLILDAGKIERTVEVEIQLDYDAETYTEIRTDTGEIINARPLSVDERQMPLGV